LSVFTFAWAIALVCIGLLATIAATKGRRMAATAQVLVVASTASLSAGSR
jgi:hypothetical protein